MVSKYKQEIISYYTKWWDNPKDIRNIIFDRLFNLLNKRIPQGNGKTALDIGLGRGKISSLLISKGYKVTSIDINPQFCKQFKSKYHTKVICKDVTSMDLTKLGRFDIVTCIELIPILEPNKIPELLKQISLITKSKFYVNISNINSLHGRWVNFKHYKKEFIHMDILDDFEVRLYLNGFYIRYVKGVGLVTPISAFPDFKGKLIPIWLAKITEPLDNMFGRYCHLYYYECESWQK
jgi:SAM-dependent methyltransferase